MATMPGTHGPREVSCNIEAIVSPGHVPKGTYEQLGGMKTYVTGPADATKRLVSIFNVLRYFDQTLQGADLLAMNNEHQEHEVSIPDWFKGNPVPTECTDKKQKKFGEWFSYNNPHGVVAALPEYVKTLQAANPFIKSSGILGYCWAGKVVEHVTFCVFKPIHCCRRSSSSLV